MPELPEVELVAKSLRILVAGRRIASAELRRARLAPDHDAADFAARLEGATIRDVNRRGKHILFDLANSTTLIVHLRMSGRFMLLGPDRPDPKFTHAVFYLEDETRIVFQDQRHFGYMRIAETAELESSKELSKLAPEPLSANFDIAYLREQCAKTSRSVKLLLLDQTKILGLGNIYAAEALFLARINPRRPACSISQRKIVRLFQAIRGVLDESIAHGSTLNVDPENIDGSYYGGGYESSWRVYDRENEPCGECGSGIRRIIQGTRSTYFCPRCQR